MIGLVRLVSLLALILLASVEGTKPQVVELDTAGYRFTPREVEVTLGRPVRFVITAKESPHAFSIPDLELEEVVLPGEPKAIEVKFKGEGTIPFRCRFHHQQGMVGTIRIKPPEAPASSDSSPANRPLADERRGGGAGAGSSASRFPRAGGS